jgi:hypothetical protein
MDLLLYMHLSLIHPPLTIFRPQLYLFRGHMPHYVPNAIRDLGMAAYLQPVNSFHGKCLRGMKPRSQTIWIVWTEIIGQPCVRLLSKSQEVLLYRVTFQVRTITADRVHHKCDQCLQYRNPFDLNRHLPQLPATVFLSRSPYLEINMVLRAGSRRRHHHSHLVEPLLPSVMIVAPHRLPPKAFT